jgi:uncharacterized protein YlxW (UPF0749 family)
LLNTVVFTQCADLQFVFLPSVPYSAYKENALSKIPSLRSLNNALRQDANRMSQEVDRLSEEIDALETEANR